MKIFIVVVHILLGLLIIFYSVNSLLHIANLATQDPGNQYYYGISLSQGVAEAILRGILGLFSILGALAFRKDRRWATLTLPLVPIISIIMMFYSARSLGGYAGVVMIFIIPLLIFLVSEILYITLRKPTQFS